MIEIALICAVNNTSIYSCIHRSVILHPPSIPVVYRACFERGCTCCQPHVACMSMSMSEGHLRRRVKSLVEDSLGVSISRRPTYPPNKHADAELARIRDWSGRDVVIDAGANDGRTILRIQERLSSPRIFAFEPVSATYETLVRRTAHLDNVSCFQLALGAVPGRETIFLTDIDAMNSFSPDWATTVGTEEVKVATVDGFMEEQGIDFVHFLKVDVEGHDLEVLKGAKQALSSSRIAIVQVEVGVDQLDRDQPSLEQIRSYLAPMGYYLYGIYNQCRQRVRTPQDWPDAEAFGYRPKAMVYCDALFISAAL